MRSIIPSGRMKGRALEDLTKAEHHILWAAWNGSPRLKASPFFQNIVADFDRRKGLPVKEARDPKICGEESEKSLLIGRLQKSLDFEAADNAPVLSMPFGKHKGVPICDVPRDYLTWCAENLTSTALRLMVVAELEHRGPLLSKVAVAKPAKPTKTKRTPECNNDSATHYGWVDSDGFEHRIPNDVSMVGRGFEVCPF